MLNFNHNKLSLPLISSVVFHLFIFIAIGIYFEFPVKLPALGNTSNNALNAYVFDDHSSQTITLTEKQNNSVKSEKTIATNNKHDIALQQHSRSQEAKSSSIKQSKESHGDQTNTLVALLHSAIQNQQHYPASAIQLEREGKITLAFTLYTNGTISHLRIIKSSQTNSLDDAAIAAVRDAAPFHEVKKYLQETQEYTIDVVFKLTENAPITRIDA